MKLPKKLMPQELLVAVLPTTEGGKTIEVKVSWFPWWQDKHYVLLLRLNFPTGVGFDAEPSVKLESASAFSFKKLQALAGNCLLRDDVRGAIHRLCSEQGLKLLNPVF